MFIKILKIFLKNNIYYIDLFLKYYVIKYIYLFYFFIFLISFFEALVFIGILIPSSFIMFIIGYLIGKKILNFYICFFLNIIGYFFGDIISYFIGIYYKKYLNEFKKNIFFSSFYLKNFFSFFKENTFFFILLGKFFGPLKSFILFLSGMLLIPIYKIFFPNLLSISLWSILYFIPGIIYSISLNLPINYSFNLYLFIFLFLVFINIFLSYKWYMLNNFKFYYINLNKNLFKYFFIVFMLIWLNVTLNIEHNTIFSIFIKLIYKLFILY